MKKLFLFALLFPMLIFLTSTISAQDEILLQVNLFNDGSASVIGSSTINPEIEDIEYDNQTIYGLTQHLTSKHEERWSFFLNLDGNFKSIYVKIVLPENAKLGTIDSSIEPTISVQGKNIILEFIGENVSLNIKFYYELETKNQDDSGYYFLIIAVIVSVILIVLWLIFRKRKIRKDENQGKIKKIEKKGKKKGKKGFEEKLRLVRPTLNERENKIIKELLEHKKLKQNQLQNLTKIPKVSLSRHLANLENKNLIIKKSLGKTNIIQINKKFDKKEK